jgi:multidrug efflux pump subunit AcrA (membrane-fusion protein)
MAHADPVARDNSRAIADAALARLKNWDISADQLARLQRTGIATRTLTLRAPSAGVVMDKQALEGLHFAAGDTLHRIADLSTVWLPAEVYEQDLAQIRPGDAASIHGAGLSRPRVRGPGLRSQWDADMIRLSYLLLFELATGQPCDDGRYSFQIQCILIRGGTGCSW